MEKLTTKKYLVGAQYANSVSLDMLKWKKKLVYEDAFKIAKDFGLTYTFIGALAGVSCGGWARTFNLITTLEAVQMGLTIFGSFFVAGTLINAGMIYCYTYKARKACNNWKKVEESIKKKYEEEKSL